MCWTQLGCGPGRWHIPVPILGSLPGSKWAREGMTASWQEWPSRACVSCSIWSSPTEEILGLVQPGIVIYSHSPWFLLSEQPQTDPTCLNDSSRLGWFGADFRIPQLPSPPNLPVRFSGLTKPSVWTQVGARHIWLEPLTPSFASCTPWLWRKLDTKLLRLTFPTPYFPVALLIFLIWYSASPSPTHTVESPKLFLSV